MKGLRCSRKLPPEQGWLLFLAVHKSDIHRLNDQRRGTLLTRFREVRLSTSATRIADAPPRLLAKRHRTSITVLKLPKRGLLDWSRGDGDEFSSTFCNSMSMSARRAASALETLK